MIRDIKEIIKNSTTSDDTTSGIELMQDAEYLRKSSSIITDALQKGFDVLQLENGDIITTGTKTVVYQYRWDTKNQKMVKMTAKERRDAEKRVKADRHKETAKETVDA
ncbi:MAG: DUF2671 domain-containing protein [Hyphomicrobiales bacterium]|nr:DUF2671 domain-containing protein [Rickettsiales bacterium]MCP5361059.1 DUF2671 domain-containing protein [Hyphomicrobiales bacterium]